VLFGWAWTYFTYERGARLITGEPSPQVVSDQRTSPSRGEDAVA
jgi:hypothetical protein